MTKDNATMPDDAEAIAAAAASDDAPPETAQDPSGEGLDPETLGGELAEARKLAEEHWEMVLRTRADLDNLRKRSQRELENARKYALERFMSELLPVRDSLEAGLGASGDEVDGAQVREGLELTLKMFDAATARFGLAEVDPQGAPFDPECHQAMSVQEDPDAASGTVVLVVQKGYLLNDRLVRPAMVIVAK
jgi:molecular chaperone GrpE